MVNCQLPSVSSVYLALALVSGLAASAHGGDGSLRRPVGSGWTGSRNPSESDRSAASPGYPKPTSTLNSLFQDEGSPASRWWNRIYAAGYYDTRWDSWFLNSHYLRGYDLQPDRRMSVYGIALLSADSRSSTQGPAPVIISDNVLVLGAGLRFRPEDWIWFDLQQGLAFDLVDRGGSSVHGDFRLTATGGAGMYPEFTVHPEFRSPLTLLADFYFSSGYYSRYENWITYVQGRAGARVLEVSRAFADLYARADFAFDGAGDFYNNYVEIGPGLRFTPDPEWGLFFLAEYRRGLYTDVTREMHRERIGVYPAQYDAVRLYLVLDLEF